MRAKRVNFPRRLAYVGTRNGHAALLSSAEGRRRAGDQSNAVAGPESFRATRGHVRGRAGRSDSFSHAQRDARPRITSVRSSNFFPDACAIGQINRTPHASHVDALRDRLSLAFLVFFLFRGSPRVGVRAPSSLRRMGGGTAREPENLSASRHFRFSPFPHVFLIDAGEFAKKTDLPPAAEDVPEIRAVVPQLPDAPADPSGLRSAKISHICIPRPEALPVPRGRDTPRLLSLNQNRRNTQHFTS